MSKIAIVIGDLGTPGGAERVAYDLANEFVQRGHDFTLITFEEKNKPAYLPSPGRHIHYSIPSKAGNVFSQLLTLLKRAWTFRRLFNRERFDHVFAFMETANVPCALAHPRAVLSVHINPEEWTARQLTLIRLVFPRAQRVIAVSAKMQQSLESLAGLKNALCVINPVDTQLLYNMAEDSVSHPRPFVLAVGRLSPEKGFGRLIRSYAATALSDTCDLIILGEGQERTHLESLIKDHSLQEKVFLPGLESNPYRYMARAEFLAMSSDYEGYPLVLVEALALGCPVVSVDCPYGPREIINHEDNGLLVAPANEQALSAALDRLYYDDQLRAKLARQAPASVQNNDIKRVADAWLAA